MFLGNINQTRPSKRISAVNNTRRAECRQDQRITALEKEVNRLRKSLTQELSLRNALNRGFHRALGSLPRIPNNLPVQVCFSDSML
jgi:predicted RNase H-like nuclease (RuvC/YqgF family)